jgi:hypothetical protein
MPFLARISIAFVLIWCVEFSLVCIFFSNMWLPGWSICFLLIYSIIDARFGKRLICESCGRQNIRRGFARCPSCHAKLIAWRTSFIQIIVTLVFVFLWWTSSYTRVWFYSGSRYYFYIGQGSIGLDWGIH